MCMLNILKCVWMRVFICTYCLEAREQVVACLCVTMYSPLFVCVHVFLRVRGVREKSLSQCMTLSNRLGIKLMTTKTFSALKPIYTPIQASLMSALKSTTNSPWRKSLAHRGCSGCLSLCVCVCVCVCVFVCACVCEP